MKILSEFDLHVQKHPQDKVVDPRDLAHQIIVKLELLTEHSEADFSGNWRAHSIVRSALVYLQQMAHHNRCPA